MRITLFIIVAIFALLLCQASNTEAGWGKFRDKLKHKVDRLGKDAKNGLHKLGQHSNVNVGVAGKIPIGKA